jgi:hypothetical protein
MDVTPRWYVRDLPDYKRNADFTSGLTGGGAWPGAWRRAAVNGAAISA